MLLNIMFLFLIELVYQADKDNKNNDDHHVSPGLHRAASILGFFYSPFSRLVNELIYVSYVPYRGVRFVHDLS